MIRVEAVAKSYPTRSGPLVVLRDIHLTLRAVESAAIMGPSGCGKSTLLNILGTLEPPTSGCVTIDGQNPFLLSNRELAAFRNRRIGFVFQEHHLLPQCSVLENVLLPTLVNGAAGTALRARELLDRVGLTARLDHRPAELSGGERQRTAIARALINHPALVLADEPTGNLDRASAETIAGLLTDLVRTDGVALLLVTHSETLARRAARRFELAEGKLVEP